MASFTFRLLGFALLTVFVVGAAYANDTAKDEGGSLVIAPYAWALNMSGTVGLNGIDVPLNLQSTELLSGVKSGGMGYMQWQTDTWFLYLEGILIDFGEKNFAPLFNQSVESSVLFVEAGGGVNIDLNGVQVSPYVGGRMIKLKVKVDGPLLRQSEKQDWVDPVIGVLVQKPLSQRFSWLTKLDAGGFNTNDSNYHSIASLLLYHFNERWTLGAGYRYSAFEASDSGNGLTMDLDGHGPMGGLQFSF